MWSHPVPPIPELPDCYLPLSRTFLEGKDEGQEKVPMPASLGDGVPGLGYKRGRVDPQFLQGGSLLRESLSCGSTWGPRCSGPNIVMA